jgi:DGQHR domain-containing protein
MQINLPDPPLHEGIAIFGNSVSPTEFQGVLNHGRFKKLVPDPRRLEGHLGKYNPDLSAIADLRRKVQRLIASAKKKNTDQYARYVIDMVRTGEGFTPQIVLYCEKPLRVETDPHTGFAWALVPDELIFVAIDGDTQTAARNLADGLQPGLFEKERIKVVIKHGIPVSQAEQIFAISNTRGVKVTTSLAIGMDNRDPATQLTKHVEQQVPTLRGRVNRQKRQLGGQDEDLITISALRASVVCFLEGINGIQNQTKPAEFDEAHGDELRAAAVMWFTAAATALNGALLPEQRANTFASSPAVWCAIGALGHDTLVELVGEDFEKPATPAAAEYAFKALAEAKLATIDWARGSRWLSVGAKQSISGAITLGGPKETGSLVHKAFKEGTLSKVSIAA